jgi:2-methylcitrate dehydratase PrpD
VTKLTETIARAITATQYDDLPSSIRSKTRFSILDTLGVMVPPSRLDETCNNLAAIVAEESGPGQSTLMGLRKKGASIMAAYLNGSFAHVLDYDDTIDDLGHHPSAQTVPAALAVAERVGSVSGPVSGQKLMTAVAVGSDLGARLSAAPTGALGVDHHWFPISNVGVFSATAAAGKILGLSEEQMINALGLALHRCHGQLEAIAAPESELRAIRDGFINKEGVMCALLAESGVKACHNAIELFFATYYDNQFDADTLLTGLGEQFRNGEVSLKPWPCCRLTHGYIEATRQILADNAIAPDHIQHITCVVPEGTRTLFCEPEAEKRAPSLSIQAKFSLFFTVALGVVKTPEIADFLPDNLQRPDVLSMVERVHCRVSDALGPAAAIAPAIVEIQTTDGQSFSARVDEVYGHPNKPMSETDVIGKFRDCLQYARMPIPARQIDQLVDMLLHLDAVEDIGEISKILP